MRKILLLTLLAIPAHGQTLAPFSAALLPRSSEVMQVVDGSLSVTAKNQRMKLEKRDGFVTYTSSYTPKFHYLSWGQKMNFPGFTVTQPVQVSKEAGGIAYAFEGHDQFREMNIDKYARLQILRKDDGSCEMSWALKNTRRGEVQDQAVGAVRYPCGKPDGALNASN